MEQREEHQADEGRFASVAFEGLAARRGDSNHRKDEDYPGQRGDSRDCGKHKRWHATKSRGEVGGKPRTGKEPACGKTQATIPDSALRVRARCAEPFFEPWAMKECWTSQPRQCIHDKIDEPQAGKGTEKGDGRVEGRRGGERGCGNRRPVFGDKRAEYDRKREGERSFAVNGNAEHVSSLPLRGVSGWTVPHRTRPERGRRVRDR